MRKPFGFLTDEFEQVVGLAHVKPRSAKTVGYCCIRTGQIDRQCRPVRIFFVVRAEHFHPFGRQSAVFVCREELVCHVPAQYVPVRFVVKTECADQLSVLVACVIVKSLFSAFAPVSDPEVEQPAGVWP